MSWSSNPSLGSSQSTFGWLVAVFSTLGQLGCGASPTPTVVPTPLGAGTSSASAGSNPTVPETPLLEQMAKGATRELALKELAPDIARFLVGPEWATMVEHATLSGLDWSTWLVDNHVVNQTSTSARFTATLTRHVAERALTEFASCSLPTQSLTFPDEWQSVFVPALLAEREWAVCQSKQTLLSITCQRQAPLNERLAVTGLIADLSLEPLLRDGIPVRAGADPVWSFDVQVRSGNNANSVGIAGVPLELVPEPSPATTPFPESTLKSAPSSVSDAQGWVHFELPPTDGPLRVSVSSSALLGPFAGLTELPQLPITTRRLDDTRQLVIELSAPGNHQPSGLGTTLVRELSLVYGKPLPTLDAQLTRSIQRSVLPGVNGATLVSADLRRQVIEKTRGSVDFIVLVTGETEFASQMGADRTWYAARGRAQVVELWSGQMVALFEESATGSGFGDQAAEQAAQLAVVQQLRSRLQTWRAP